MAYSVSTPTTSPIGLDLSRLVPEWEAHATELANAAPEDLPKLVASLSGGAKPVVVLGRDTRASSEVKKIEASACNSLSIN